MEDDEKRVTFITKLDTDARVQAILKREQIHRNIFFRLMMQKLIDRDKRILEILNEYRNEKEKQSQRDEEVIKDRREKGETLKEDFNLEGDEIQNIYDIIEGVSDE